MQLSRSKSFSSFFYGGALLSSIGSMTLTVSLIGFMLKNNFSLFEVGIVTGLSRLIPILVSTFFGQLADKWSPRSVIIFTEIGAALTSIGLFVGWQRGHDGYLLILAFMILRAVFVSFQTGSRSKIAKLLSQDTLASNAKNAIWLNKATQGATLFAGVLGLFAISFTNFESVILFDALTFILNGFIVFFLISYDEQSESGSKQTVIQKFYDLYQSNQRVAVLDLLLAVAMMGTSSIMARLAGSEEQWVSIFLISYGLSVWISGFTERTSFFNKIPMQQMWLLMGTAYAVLGFVPGPNFLVWVICFAKDFSYWTIFHRISAEIQHNTPKEKIASVTHARMAQMIAVLSVGEIAVGAWRDVLPMWAEGLWRGSVCILVVLLLRSATKNESRISYVHSET